MPAVTVEELWRLALPSGTTLEAGEGGLEREVTWPALLRSRPPAFDPLRGGEIALVSLQIARMLDERLTLTRIVRSLTEVGVSAVVVVGEIDDEAKQIAENAGLPLLLLPPGSNLHRTEQAITRTVLDRRAELYQRSQDIYQQLTELVISGRGVGAIIERLSELTGRPVALEDDTLTLRAYASPSPRGPARDALARALEEGRTEVRNWLRAVPPSASDPPTAKFAVPSLTLSRLVAPVISRDRIAGYLSVFALHGDLGELERLAASRGAAACAIETVKEWAVIEAEDRLHVDLIDELLSGELTSTEALQSRAKRLGFDINRLHGVLVFRTAEARELAVSRGGVGTVTAARTAPAVVLDKLLERELSTRGLNALIGAKEDFTTLLYPLPSPADVSLLKSAATELGRAVSAQAGTPVSVGIGCPRPGLEGIRAAHREAQQAVAMGNRLFDPGSVTYFGDLGLYRLLFSVSDAGALKAFFDDTLAKLVAYDGRNDGELVKTLDAYFACHASPTDAARKLHLHRNTLLYRLRRIQEITGLDLDDAEICLALHLALRVKDVLRAMPS